jgi:hypothetical protein
MHLYGPHGWALRVHTRAADNRAAYTIKNEVDVMEKSSLDQYIVPHIIEVSDEHKRRSRDFQVGIERTTTSVPLHP